MSAATIEKGNTSLFAENWTNGRNKLLCLNIRHKIRRTTASGPTLAFQASPKLVELFYCSDEMRNQRGENDFRTSRRDENCYWNYTLKIKKEMEMIDAINFENQRKKVEEYTWSVSLHYFRKSAGNVHSFFENRRQGRGNRCVFLRKSN